MGTASAHHSLDATYDLSKNLHLEGKVLAFIYRNPHTFLQLEVLDANGITRRWAIESDSAHSLHKPGIESDSLKMGDQVALTIHPSRKPEEHRGVLMTLQHLPGGIVWEVKSKISKLRAKP